MSKYHVLRIKIGIPAIWEQFRNLGINEQTIVLYTDLFPMNLETVTASTHTYEYKQKETFTVAVI